MKAESLRIGNYLYDSVLHIVKVECIMSDRYVSWDDKESNLEFSYPSDESNMYRPDPNELCPIPLTDEILTEWCGFIKYDSGYGEKDGGFSIEKAYANVKNGKSWTDGYCYDCMDEYLIGEPIKYLHQLQNLYYALTGKELQIKLPKTMTKTEQLQKIVAEMANEIGSDITVTITYRNSDLTEARVYEQEYLPDVKIEEL